MEESFWSEIWKKNDLGFHQADINPHLKKYWSLLPLKADDSVFVPLCGKTLDMLWILDQGVQVVGVELSELAIESFFAENQLTYTQEKVSSTLTCYRNQHLGLTLWQGDFFQLPPSALANVQAVYDRAAMVALPPEMRHAYVEQLQSILPSAHRLLVVMEYIPEKNLQGELLGPPFSVTENEIRQEHGQRFMVELLETETTSKISSAFFEKGAREVTHKVYHLKPKASSI